MFGRVIEGMPVVKRMEVCGTRSGKPNKKVTITNSGQVRDWHALDLQVPEI